MFAIVESAINLLDHLVRTGLGGAGKTASLNYQEEFLKPPHFPPEEDEAPPPTKLPERKPNKSSAGAVSPMPSDPKKMGRMKTKRSTSKRPRIGEPTNSNPAVYPMPNNPVSHNVIGNIGMPARTNYFINHPNQTTNPAFNKTIVQNPSYHPTNTGMRKQPAHADSKQALQNMLVNRRVVGSQMRGGIIGRYDGSRAQPSRQKQDAIMKASMHMSGADMYMKQPMRGQLPQQAHIMGQSNTNSYYNVAPKQTAIHGYNTVGGNAGVYRNPSNTQLSYQQSGQQFVTSQTAMRRAAYNPNPIHQGHAGYQPQGMMGMQNQGQQQYTINQHPGGGGVQMGSMGGQQMVAGVHSMSSNQTMQQSTMINQRQMMEQHPQMVSQNINNQFGQTMQASGGPMMDMSRPIIDRQQYG